jgi:hypothetical protein
LSNEQPAASVADKSVLDILPLDEAVNKVALDLRMQAAPDNTWGSQEAVSKWLNILADDLDDCVKELKRRGIK